MSQQPSKKSTGQTEPLNFKLHARNHAEEMALFRMQVIGPLLAHEASEGPRAELLRELTTRRYRPPGSDATRTFGERTLRRWVAAFNKGDLQGLESKPRNDRGHGRALTADTRQVLIDIRQEYPSVSTPVILSNLRTAEQNDSKVSVKGCSLATVNRLYHDLALTRTKIRPHTHSGERRKWQAANPGDVWHADVCHSINLSVEDGTKTSALRIHGILDDASRRIMAIAAATNERERTMIDLLVSAIRHYGAPRVLYLDNGPTYRGEELELICGRLGIRLVHAKPYDPQARGKMERFWRTLREQCLQFIDSKKTHDEVQGDLLRYLKMTYHKNPHAGLCGHSPDLVWQRSKKVAVSEETLKKALEMRRAATVRNDGSILYNGQFYQVSKTYLCGKRVEIITSLYDSRTAEIEYNSERFALTRVDAVRNGLVKRRKVDPSAVSVSTKINFDPNLIRAKSDNGEQKGETHE